MQPSDLVDMDRYDLLDSSLIERCAEEFRNDGIVVLPGFIRPEVVDLMVAESNRLAPYAHHCVSHSTPYLDKVMAHAGPRDPRGAIVQSSVAAVAYDLFPDDSLLRSLYEWDGLKDFVAAVLDEPVLHRYADPFGALNLAVMEDGDALGWHFDFTDFVVSLALQAPEAGGEFENAKKIRSSEDENYDDVAAVLADEAPERVRTEPMTPGTLVLFNGRWSLHRVTPIEGDIPRYVALLSYDRRPDADSTDSLKLSRYGRLPGDPPRRAPGLLTQ